MGHSQAAMRWKTQPVKFTLTVVSSAIFLSTIFYAVHWHANCPVIPFDDAYITFRYADNFHSGNGLVYNKNERVFGVSSSLYLIVLIGLKYLFASPTSVLAIRINAVFYILTAVFIIAALTRRRLSFLPAFLAGSVFVMQPDMLLYSSGGMESQLFTALLAAFLFAVSVRRWTSASFLLGMSCLARPEGVIFCSLGSMALFLMKIYRTRKDPDFSLPFLKMIAAMWVPVAVWALFAYVYYGTVIPHSITAKMKPLYPLPAGKAFRQMIMLIEYWTFRASHARVDRIVSPLTIALLSAGIAGSLADFKKSPVPALSCCIFISLFATYSLGNPLLAGWYYPALYLFWFLTVFLGIPALISHIADRVSHVSVSQWKRPLKNAAVAVLIIFFSWNTYKVYRSHPEGLASALQNDARRLRTQVYLQAGDWLNLNAHDKTAVSPEIGALGYAFRGKLLDSCGLVTPEALPFIPVPENERISPGLSAISSNFVMTLKPDLIVTLNCFAAASLFRSNDFNESYKLWKSFPLPKKIWKNSDCVLIYKADKDFAESRDIPRNTASVMGNE